MTVREWFEAKLHEAKADIRNHEFAMEMAKERYQVYVEMVNCLPVEQMENIQVAASAAKEK